MNQPRLIIPVESSSRELEAKLLLSLFAAEAGYRCVFGADESIHRMHHAPALYIAKNVRFSGILRLVAALGHTVVAWDEEGLVRFHQDIHHARMESDVFDIPRLLLAWGDNNAAAWRAHPGYNGLPVEVTGNPRIDLLRPELSHAFEDDIREIQQRYGKFVLVNTNFGYVNNIVPGGPQLRTTGKSLDRHAFAAFREQVTLHKQRLFDSFRVALPELARIVSPSMVVVRPHPSERLEPWLEIAADIGNIEVARSGPVVPWLRAARCIVHNGCTTAVEASVMKRPVLSFLPLTDDRLDLHLPNRLGEQFGSIYALGKRALSILGQSCEPEREHERLLREHVCALNGRFACERIVTALQSVAVKSPSIAERTLHAMAYFADRGRRFVKPLLSRRQTRRLTSADDFDLCEIRARAAGISAALGRFKDVEIDLVAPGVLLVNRAGERIPPGSGGRKCKPR